ncbi:MAG TPA: hypothetical protein VHC19_20845, partial [Pirellulales bacterium]|nr:hypothetical protein [Pirellulales bacterium]
MPDWSYQTVFRPLLFRLRPQMARSIALGGMGALARLPLGRGVIQLMGHMQPDARLAIERNEICFPSQVGLGCRLDPHLLGSPALAEFGFGFLEIGPIVVEPPPGLGELCMDAADETIHFAAPLAAISAAVARERLEQDGPFKQPLSARLEPASAEEAEQMVALLADRVDGFVAPVNVLKHMHGALASHQHNALLEGPALFVAVDAKTWQDASQSDLCVSAIRAGQVAGIVVGDEAAPDEEIRIGKAGFQAALQTVREMREQFGGEPIIISSVGVHSPADALEYIEAGGDLVQVDSGLVFAGPGLPKRINAALLYRRQITADAPAKASAETAVRLGGQAWFWALMMGLSMLIGGTLAMLIATTRVVMPYDESMAGLTR